MTTKSIDYDKLRLKAVEIFNNALSKNDRRKLIESLAYLLALETGLRVGDLLRLKYESIEYNNEIRKYLFTSPIKKTKESHTGVISVELSGYIDLYIKALRGLNYTVNEHIFYNYQHNTMYTRQWLHKQFKIIGNDLGFVDFGVHSIRKASAIRILDLTGSLSLAQYHLTHKRATTTDKYLNVSKMSAIEKLSKLY